MISRRSRFATWATIGRGRSVHGLISGPLRAMEETRMRVPESNRPKPRTEGADVPLTKREKAEARQRQIKHSGRVTRRGQ